MRKLLDVLILLALLGAHDAQAQATLTATDVANARAADQVAPAIVLLLTGKGDGQLESVGTGVIVRGDGIVLAGYHLVKDAREVQVRLKSGEIYDKVELIGFDERRNVAALRLPAVNLPTVSRSYSPEAKVGTEIFVISNPPKQTWTLSRGILSGVRMADDISGAGDGYLLLQHTAPVAPGTSGVLIDAHGYALGLIVPYASGEQNLNTAVPLNSVIGLENGAGQTALGKGTNLKLSEPARTPAASVVLKTDLRETLRVAKIIYVCSNTEFFEVIQLQNELRKQTEFAAWELALVDGWEGRKTADIEIEVDRPLFTYTFTYRITDTRTNIVLATGKVTAWDGNGAAPKLAKRVIEDLKKVRATPNQAAEAGKSRSNN